MGHGLLVENLSTNETKEALYIALFEVSTHVMASKPCKNKKNRIILYVKLDNALINVGHHQRIYIMHLKALIVMIHLTQSKSEVRGRILGGARWSFRFLCCITVLPCAVHPVLIVVHKSVSNYSMLSARPSIQPDLMLISKKKAVTSKLAHILAGHML